MTDDGVTTITLSGRFDASVAADFRDYVNTIVSEKPENFVVDLAAVDYIDSGGLGCLVSFLRRVRKNGGDIKVATLTDKVRVVFELTRLHRIFEIYDEASSAMRSFRAEVAVS